MDIYQNLYPDVFRVRCDFLKGSGLQKKITQYKGVEIDDSN